MAEFTAAALQAVDTRQNILYTTTVTHGTKCIVHREGSGVVTLRGITDKCSARFRVAFFGNVAIPTGGTIGPISVAIAVNGEPLAASTAIVTPAALEEQNGVAIAADIEVPKCCCVNVAVENVTAEAITVEGANFIVDKIA